MKGWWVVIYESGVVGLNLRGLCWLLVGLSWMVVRWVRKSGGRWFEEVVGLANALIDGRMRMSG